MNREKAERIKKAMLEIQDALSDINQILPNINQILSSEDTDDSEAYNKGLEDAWELAKKVGTLDGFELGNIFGVGEYDYTFEDGDSPYDRVMDMTPQEALAKLEAYEKEQEINVGDVVKSIIGEIEYLIITEEDDDDYEFGAINLHAMQVDRITNKGNSFKKTGKHIDISSILEQIKEN